MGYFIVVHLAVAAVDEQVYLLQRQCSAVLVVDVKGPLSEERVGSNLVHRGVAADDRLVVGGPREALCHGQCTASVIDRHLVPDRRKTLFPSVGTGLVVRALAPRDMGDIGRAHRACKPESVVHIHDVL